MTLHKEGYRTLVLSFIILVLLNFILYEYAGAQSIITRFIQVISLVIFLLLINFFRSPSRKIEVNDNVVLAPADGKVVVIEETTETEVLKDRRIQVSIFMSPVNVHVNRYPVSGKVTYIKYHPGSFLVAWHPKSSTENERTTIVIDSNKGIPLLVRQIAGALAKRIVYYPRENQQVVQGEELGFIKFGSRVDTFLPLTAKINVHLNQKTVGGKTVLAEL